MAKREISNLDLKFKLFKEYLENGGIERIYFPELLEDLIDVKLGPDGKVDPETVSPNVNAAMGALLGSHLMPPMFQQNYISEYASTLQKSNSFNQENIDTEEQFNRLYEEYKEKKETLFRGQREAKWRLYGKLQRQWIKEKLFEKEKNYQDFVERLVEIGKAEFGSQIKELLHTYHIDTENSISILSYLQHHGCPTPLLDWTYKFQVALFFAFEGLIPNPGSIEIEDYCSVYYIEEKYFESGNFRATIEEMLSKVEQDKLLAEIAKIAGDDEIKRKAMEKHFAGRHLIDRNKILGSGLISHLTKIENIIEIPLIYFSDKDIDSGIMFSLNNNANILHQAGVFTWNSDPSKPFELVGDELNREGKSEEEARDYAFCFCFNIHKRLAPYIRRRLEEDGITKEYIYPTSDISALQVYEKCRTK